MVRDELSSFSYEVLGLIGRDHADTTTCAGWCRGAVLRLGGREPLLRRAQAARAPGLPAHAQGAGWHNERTVYKSPDKGLRARCRWVRTPLAFTPLNTKALMRMLVADLVGEAPVARHLDARRDIIDLQARLDVAEANAGTLPHRQKYLLLDVGFMRRLFALQRIDGAGWKTRAGAAAASARLAP